LSKQFLSELVCVFGEKWPFRTVEATISLKKKIEKLNSPLNYYYKKSILVVPTFWGAAEKKTAREKLFI